VTDRTFSEILEGFSCFCNLVEVACLCLHMDQMYFFFKDEPSDCKPCNPAGSLKAKSTFMDFFTQAVTCSLRESEKIRAVDRVWWTVVDSYCLKMVCGCAGVMVIALWLLLLLPWLLSRSAEALWCSVASARGWVWYLLQLAAGELRPLLAGEQLPALHFKWWKKTAVALRVGNWE